jgi:segregation and condensation protein B
VDEQHDTTTEDAAASDALQEPADLPAPREDANAHPGTEGAELSPPPLAADAAAVDPVPAQDQPAALVAAAQVPVDAHLKAIIEALVFASPDPLTLKSMAKVLDGEPPEAIEAAVRALEGDYARAGGLQMVEVAGGYQIVTRPDLHEWVRRLFHERTTQKLSVAALETLAVIAYKQPITAAEIADVRGVNTSGVLGTLIDRKLVKIIGRKPVVGRPFMYATTREFLNRFGLRDLNDLPKVEDMADALGFEPPLLEDVATTDVLPFDAEAED